MKVEPIVHAPNTTQTANTSANTSMRERAISAFKASEAATAAPIAPPPAQAQALPVQNATKVSPEEMSAVQGQSNTIETPEQDPATQPLEATPEKAQEEQPLSPQYAILARKEKMFRQKVQQQDAALKAEKAALETERQAIKAKEAEYQSNYISKSRLTEDAMGVLLEAGITYDQITQMALNQASVQQDPATKFAIAKLQAQVKAQEDAIEQAKKAHADNQTEQYNQAVQQITSEAKQLIRLDPKFEAIRETNSVKDVVELIEKTFKADGILLSVEEAAQEVEEHLVEQLSTYAQKIKKLQSKFKPQQAAKPALGAAAPTAPQKQQPAKTLTNAVGSTRALSGRDRAILAFKGELPK